MPLPAAARVLYYALGGGLGHAVRALALARRLCRAWPGEHRLLVNSPFASCLNDEVARHPLQLHCLDPDAGPQRAKQWVDDQWQTFAPQIVVVDTFPRGLAGELPELLNRKDELRVLVGRYLRPAYVDRQNLLSFVLEHYHRVLIPGETNAFATLPHAVRTEPWLLRDFDELPHPEAAAALLDVPPTQPVALIVGSGQPSELRQLIGEVNTLASVAPRELTLRLALPRGAEHPPSLVRVVQPFPLLDCLPAASVVLGAAGYNLHHEVRALGIPAILLPRPRRYDDQARRADPELHFDSAESLAARLGQLARQRVALRPYANGTAAALDALTSAWQSHRRSH